MSKTASTIQPGETFNFYGLTHTVERTYPGRFPGYVVVDCRVNGEYGSITLNADHQFDADETAQ